MPSTVGEAASKTEVAAPWATVFGGGRASPVSWAKRANCWGSMYRAKEVSPTLPGISALTVMPSVAHREAAPTANKMFAVFDCP